MWWGFWNNWSGSSPSLRYLSRSIEDPKELWTRLDRSFGMIDEDHNRNLERKFRTTRVPYSKFSAFTLFDEVFQDEEEAKSSTQSIWIVESLLAGTHSLVALEFMRSMISHLLIYLIQNKTFESHLLKKNSHSILFKHSRVILLF